MMREPTGTELLELHESARTVADGEAADALVAWVRAEFGPVLADGLQRVAHARVSLLHLRAWQTREATRLAALKSVRS